MLVCSVVSLETSSNFSLLCGRSFSSEPFPILTMPSGELHKMMPFPPISRSHRDGVVTFIEGHAYDGCPIRIPRPAVRCIGEYLPQNYAFLLTSRTTILLPTDAEDIGRAVACLKEPCRLTICVLDGSTIPDGFLSNLSNIEAFETWGLTNVTTIGTRFLSRCTSLASFETAGMTAVTTIGDRFLGGCTSLASFETSGMTTVTTIEGHFLDGCTSLASFETSGMTAVTTIGGYFLVGCISLASFDTSGLTAVTTIGSYFVRHCPSLGLLDDSQTREGIIAANRSNESERKRRRK